MIILTTEIYNPIYFFYFLFFYSFISLIFLYTFYQPITIFIPFSSFSCENAIESAIYLFFSLIYPDLFTHDEDLSVTVISLDPCHLFFQLSLLLFFSTQPKNHSFKELS